MYHRMRPHSQTRGPSTNEAEDLGTGKLRSAAADDDANAPIAICGQGDARLSNEHGLRAFPKLNKWNAKRP